MNRRTPRSLILVCAALAVSACAEIDCNDTTYYHGSRLDKRLAVPEGLQPLETADAHKVPGGEPPADYVPQACLVKPPELVTLPKTD